MSRTLHDKVRMALASRSQWELRQSRWQEMRHDGERRQVRPWKGAADMHFPLADMLIEKMKPAYIQQVFAADTIAAFTGLGCVFGARLAPYLSRRSNPMVLKTIFAIIAICDGILFIIQYVMIHWKN